MSLNTAVISIGSNINPLNNILRAKEMLAANVTVAKESSFLATKPIGPTPQADYLNGSMLIQTEINLEQLRQLLKAIEKHLGRRDEDDRWGPRPIDLDITVWNDQIIDQDFYIRDFLRKAVLELIPELKY
jgi:2-amino-4-hydroxy-6-hydroxymethyldihydropteridine diphosphokinase